MTTEAEEILSALIDREPVDADVLARVLEQSQARALLVDFVRVRAMLSCETRRAEDVDVLGERPATAGKRGWLAHTRRGWARAAGIVMVAAGGIAGGVWLAERQPDALPPRPSHVIPFERGVDWQPVEPLRRRGAKGKQ